MSTAIEQIEIKIAYLEQANAELSDVVYRQGRELESLRAQLAELLRRLDALQTPAEPSPQEETPPLRSSSIVHVGLRRGTFLIC